MPLLLHFIINNIIHATYINNTLPLRHCYTSSSLRRSHMLILVIGGHYVNNIVTSLVIIINTPLHWSSLHITLHIGSRNIINNNSISHWYWSLPNKAYAITSLAYCHYAGGITWPLRHWHYATLLVIGGHHYFAITARIAIGHMIGWLAITISRHLRIAIIGCCYIGQWSLPSSIEHCITSLVIDITSLAIGHYYWLLHCLVVGWLLLRVIIVVWHIVLSLLRHWLTHIGCYCH